MMDVTKQSDMSSFYRGLYKQTLGEKHEDKKESETKTEDKSAEDEPDK